MENSLRTISNCVYDALRDKNVFMKHFHAVNAKKIPILIKILYNSLLFFDIFIKLLVWKVCTSNKIRVIHALTILMTCFDLIRYLKSFSINYGHSFIQYFYPLLKTIYMKMTCRHHIEIESSQRRKNFQIKINVMALLIHTNKLILEKKNEFSTIVTYFVN